MSYLFKFPFFLIVLPFLFMFIILAIRKFTYKLYLCFSSPLRVQEVQLQRNFLFYWRSRANYMPLQVVWLYCTWVLVHFDRYIPIIDCKRQATKAQYFYDYGWARSGRSATEEAEGNVESLDE